MRKNHRGQMGTIFAVVAVIFLFIIGFAIWQYFQPVVNPPHLVVTSQYPSLVGGQSGTILVDVMNDGSSTAQNVVVKYTSTEVNLVSDDVSIDPQSSKTIHSSGNVQDVRNGWYNATLTLTYVSDFSHTVTNNTNIYIRPNVQLVDLRWDTVNLIFQKDTVGRTDETHIFFKVQSSSHLVTYTGLVVNASVVAESIGITISPAISIDPIGPQGKSIEYSFTIDTNNTPSGTYPINIQIITGGFVADAQYLTLTVS